MFYCEPGGSVRCNFLRRLRGLGWNKHFLRLFQQLGEQLVRIIDH
jgi:hypothetical protein